MFGGRRLLVPEILGLSYKIADFQSMFTRSASAVTPSEKKFNYH